MKNKKEEKRINSSVVIVLFIIVFFVFLLINVLNLEFSKIDIKYSKDKTTTTITEIKDDSLAVPITFIINGKEELINIKTYNSYLGYRINYMSDYFNVIMGNNKVLMIVNKDDSNCYLKFELLSLEDYLEESRINYRDEVDEYILTSNFYRGKDIYLKVIKSVPVEDKLNFNSRLEYMLNTFYFN